MGRIMLQDISYIQIINKNRKDRGNYIITYKLYPSVQKVVVQNYCHTGGFNRRKSKRMTVNCPCVIILSHATWEFEKESKTLLH